MDNKLFDASLHLHHQTARAILVSDDGDEEQAKWLPLSQVEINSIKGNIVEVTMPEWLAINKGFA